MARLVEFYFAALYKGITVTRVANQDYYICKSVPRESRLVLSVGAKEKILAGLLLIGLSMNARAWDGLITYVDVNSPNLVYP
ncbi:MAG: hypothetical protein ACUVWX_12095 [Kiritimatiellia bacterium]